MAGRYCGPARSAWTNSVVVGRASLCLTGWMRMRVVAPSARLAPFVRQLTFVEPDASFAGLRGTARRMRTSPGGGVVLASFRPGAAAAFFRVPQHELFGATVPLGDLVPRAAVAETADRVREAKDHASRVAAFEAFLLARLDPARIDPLVAEAARRVASDPAGLRVAALARALGLSQDRLEKRFRRAVGTTPKQLASILRLRRAVEAH